MFSMATRATLPTTDAVGRRDEGGVCSEGGVLRLDEEKSGPASRLWIVRKDF